MLQLFKVLLLSKSSISFTPGVKISERYIEHYAKYSLFIMKGSKSEIKRIGIWVQICKTLSFGSNDYSKELKMYSVQDFCS